MWVEVATGHPAYASELFQSLTGITQPPSPADGGVWPVLGPGATTIGRIRPLDDHEHRGRVLPVFPVPEIDASLAAAAQLSGSVRPIQALASQPVYEIRDPAGNTFAVTGNKNHSETRQRRWPPGGLFAELVAEDVSRLVPFYSAVLAVNIDVVKATNLPAGMAQPEDGYRILTREQTIVAGALGRTFFLRGGSSLSWLVYLEVPNLGKAIVTAAELGCRVLVPAGTSPQGQYAVIEDPDHLPWGLGVTAEIPKAPPR
ncbi:MAG: hypothetical protein KIT69_00170 [Propionibacteriaceae bacterium]|nr:hypothetical protein [Propionibacteriaceae bacterium]